MALGTKNLFEFKGVFEIKGVGQGQVIHFSGLVSASTLLLESGDRLLLESGGTDVLLLE